MIAPDELALFCQQLGALIRSGTPLPAALLQLAQELKPCGFRRQLRTVATRLADGHAPEAAVEHARWPVLLQTAFTTGVRAHDLPAALEQLAAHYHEAAILTARLRTLTLYPLLVLAGSVIVTVVVAWFMAVHGTTLILEGGAEWGSVNFPNPWTWTALFAPPGLLVLATLGLGLGWSVPPWRRRLGWVLPGFQEAALARLAAGFELLLSRGVRLPEAIDLLRRGEGESPLAGELARWRRNVESGGNPLADPPEECPVPPLFAWIVTSAGEDLVTGFRDAAEVFAARARHYADLLLFGLMPASVVILAVLLITQALPFAVAFHHLRLPCGVPTLD